VYPKGADVVPSWYAKTNIRLTPLVGIGVLLPPLIAVLVLITSTKLLGVRFTEPYVALAVISALLCWIFMGGQRLQRDQLYSDGFTLAGRIAMAWLAIAGALLLIGYATKTSDIFSRRALFLWFAATPPTLLVAFLLLRQGVRLALMSSSNARKVVIVGVNRMSMELARIILDRPELALKFHCFFDNEEPARRAADSGFDARFGCSKVRDYVNEHGIHVVFVAWPIDWPRTRRVLDDLRDTTASVYLIPDISVYDLIQSRSDDIHGVPVIALCESPFQGISAFVKRGTDIAVAALLLLLASPLMLAIYVAIRLTSSGGAIFKQDRYGLDGERIVVYKFRTMTVTENGHSIVQAKRNDARVTRIGRFLRRTSLDELPQLVNVLQGRMSLVGPRPHAVAHNEQYRKLISGYMVRHKVAPGITGLAQINGCRGETATLEDMRRRVELDIEYLRRWCWLLDIKIMISTCFLLFRDERAY
jgi:putative colanic acid biosynthesis UDP-glucose lipid carrier transferase